MEDSPAKAGANHALLFVCSGRVEQAVESNEHRSPKAKRLGPWCARRTLARASERTLEFAKQLAGRDAPVVSEGSKVAAQAVA